MLLVVGADGSKAKWRGTQTTDVTQLCFHSSILPLLAWLLHVSCKLVGGVLQWGKAGIQVPPYIPTCSVRRRAYLSPVHAPSW